MQIIYLDNNATTAPAPEVVEAMGQSLADLYGNPSSTHRLGQEARRRVDLARQAVCKLLNAATGELLFTSGGTEAINTAIRGIYHMRRPRTKIIISTVEHAATTGVCDQLYADGAQIIEIGVDHDGKLDLPRLQRELDDQVALVSVMWANNETGVIFPVAEIARLCRAAKVLFHCDATQAIGKVPVDVKATGVDALSFAAHKFHGPKGVGGLFVRRGVRMSPLVAGGTQEFTRRGGTENLIGIVGMGVAAELAQSHLAEMPQVALLRDYLEQEILPRIPETFINGGGAPRVPNTTNLGFSRLESEAVLMLLSERGICASAGAACASGSLEPSHVLKAMQIDPRVAHGAIRLSLSRYTTRQEIDRVLEVLPGVITKLRSTLPVG